MWTTSVFVVIFSVVSQASSRSKPFVTLDTTKILRQTDQKFLSFALDAHIIEERWKNFNFSSRRALNLASHLSPAYLRVGGTAADLVIFTEKESPIVQTPIKSYSIGCYCTTNKEETEKVCEDLDALYAKGNFSLTGMDWMNINEFAKKSGLTVLFDFNVLLRNPDGSWNSENAKEILTFSQAMGYKNIAWELGNEPNSLMSQLGFNLTGYQLGKDYYRLKKLLTKFPMYANSTLVGPDINRVDGCASGVENGTKPEFRVPCQALQYLEKVYIGSRGVLDALTWHHYYMDGATATVKDFVDPKHLAAMVLQFEGVAKFLTDHGWDQKDVWLGETGSGYDGGTHGLSDRYASGLLWLNKLGLAAQHNYKVVIRQTFYHGCYALVGEDGFPNPDYWISAIYKKVVSNKVLNVTNQNFPPTFNLYGHCSSPNASGIQSVTLFGVNMGNETFEFGLGSPLNGSRIESYYFSTRDGNLTDREILLNGKELQITSDDDLPDFLPVVSPPADSLSLPQFGMAFWVFPNVTLNICNS